MKIRILKDRSQRFYIQLILTNEITLTLRPEVCEDIDDSQMTVVGEIETNNESEN